MGNDSSNLRSYDEHTGVPRHQSRWGGCLGCLTDPATKKGMSDSESYAQSNPISVKDVRKLLTQDLGRREDDRQSFLNPLQRLRASHAHHTRNVSEPGLPGLSEEDLLQAAPYVEEKQSIRTNPLKPALEAAGSPKS
ncbi:hypothetical protein WJX84_005992 [Apatococcus fuscideae]|uniref:Uncharacterized protein n=1 Tax=Apatococcus fuscideae TaxID=2026836 RepID=A0AAW1RK92_9CHLO